MPITRRQVLLALPFPLLPRLATSQPRDRTTTLVVPYPPGSAPDLLARLLATPLSTSLGGSVIVDNRPGANAIIGSEYVSKAKPDGATLLVVDRMTLIVNPLLYKKLPYDPKRLQGVSDLARVNLLLTVRSDAPYKDWAGFVAYAKANPGTVSIGSGGPGSVHHLSLELISKATGARFTHVPYRGVAPAVQDLLGGQLAGVISGMEVIRPHLPGGKLRILAIGASSRSPLLPDVPTLTELGVKETLLLPTTFSLLAPTGTPDSVLGPLGQAVRAIMATPDMATRLLETGLIPAPSTPAEMQADLSAAQPRLANVIRDANIHLD